MKVTKAELTKAKRAVLVLDEIAKASMAATGHKRPLAMKQDLLALAKLLKKIEEIVV